MSYDWTSAPNAAVYLPTLRAAEDRYGIPRNLLGRIAYQESSFKDSVVEGPANPEGAIGLMQLEPRWFPDAGRYWADDVDTAAALLARLDRVFGNWQLALAAYNDGQENVAQWMQGKRQLPQQTKDYVTAIVADVPVVGPMVDITLEPQSG